MDNLYKLTGGAIVAPAVVALMKHEWWLTGATLDNADHEFPLIKKMALGVMTLVEGSSLSKVLLNKLNPKESIHDSDLAGKFIIVLHADQNVLVMSGDETVPVQSGDVWWARGPSSVINNSGDHAVVLDVVVGP